MCEETNLSALKVNTYTNYTMQYSQRK